MILFLNDLIFSLKIKSEFKLDSKISFSQSSIKQYNGSELRSWSFSSIKIHQLHAKNFPQLQHMTAAFISSLHIRQINSLGTDSSGISFNGCIILKAAVNFFWCETFLKSFSEITTSLLINKNLQWRREFIWSYTYNDCSYNTNKLIYNILY